MCMYMYMYIHMCIYIYIYIYTAVVKGEHTGVSRPIVDFGRVALRASVQTPFFTLVDLSFLTPVFAKQTPTMKTCIRGFVVQIWLPRPGIKHEACSKRGASIR